MKYNPDIHHRRSIRLKNYDYSQACSYFVTTCTQNRECLFGNINNGQMDLNEVGEIVDFTWNDLPNHNENIILDAFIIMPNYICAIISIVGAQFIASQFIATNIKTSTENQKVINQGVIKLLHYKKDMTNHAYVDLVDRRNSKDPPFEGLITHKIRYNLK